MQKKKLKYKIKIKKINYNFKIKDLKGNALPIYDIEYNQKKAFEKISKKSNKYIFKCFNSAIKLSKNNKVLGFINCPVSKETLFKKENHGVTEFLSKKFNLNGKEVMLIYNKNFAVCPLTTHVAINEVTKKITKP